MSPVNTSPVTVVGLFYYPVKGMQSHDIQDSWPVEATGLMNDRRFMVVDQGGKFVTQRTCPELATIGAWGSPTEQVVSIILETGGRDGASGEIVLSDQNEHMSVKVWGDAVDALVGFSGGVDEWLSDLLKRKVRLVYMPPSARRPSRGQIEGILPVLNSFADGFPFLLTSMASLRDFNARLEAKGLGPVWMDRFRPNIVVDGEGLIAFEEDGWRQFRINGTTFYGMKRCGRCPVIAVDQRTGEHPDADPLEREPLKTLRERRMIGRQACFGMNLNHNGTTGLISVGDTVEIVERGPPFISH